MSPEKIDIRTLIPQRAPFVMVHRLIKATQEHAISDFTVKEDNILVVNGRLPIEGLIENVAQSCAAYLGYSNLQSGEPIKIGIVGAIKDFEVLRLPLVGEMITTYIELLEMIFNMALVHASVTINGIEIAHTNEISPNRH